MNVSLLVDEDVGRLHIPDFAAQGAQLVLRLSQLKEEVPEFLLAEVAVDLLAASYLFIERKHEIMEGELESPFAAANAHPLEPVLQGQEQYALASSIFELLGLLPPAGAILLAVY